MSTTPRRSPTIVVAVLALVAALAGTAVAGPDASTSAISKKKVKKIAKKQAIKQINELAPGLSVANAASADRAANSDRLQGKPASAFASATSEPYREVGAPGQPIFKNSWTNSGGGSSTAAFYRDPLGVVHLKGVVTGGPNSSVVFTLPPGYRPSQTLFLPAAAAGPTAANADVEQDGDVRVTCDSAGSCGFGIDGLTFRVP